MGGVKDNFEFELRSCRHIGIGCFGYKRSQVYLLWKHRCVLQWIIKSDCGTRHAAPVKSKFAERRRGSIYSAVSNFKSEHHPSLLTICVTSYVPWGSNRRAKTRCRWSVAWNWTSNQPQPSVSKRHAISNIRSRRSDDTFILALSLSPEKLWVVPYYV